MSDLKTLKEKSTSINKDVRLRALKLIFTHPESFLLDLVEGLCSIDNRDFEFLDLFGLGLAMRQAWKRLEDTDDEKVYEYLRFLYNADRSLNIGHIEHILKLINTPKSKDLLYRLRFKNDFGFDESMS